jgi:hypothetical protein
MKTIFKITFLVVAVFLMSSCTPKKPKTAETKVLDTICCIETEVQPNPINQDSILIKFGVHIDIDSSFVVSTSQLKSNSIPNWVFTMKKLKNLSIRGMRCEYEVGDYGAYCTKGDCFKIQEIPSQIKELSKLTALSLPNNDIQTLLVELITLKNLKQMDLSNNPKLQNVDNLEKILSLEFVSLSGCHLTEMPLNIGNLKHLKELDLEGNSIDEKEQTRIKKALPNCTIRFSQAQ